MPLIECVLCESQETLEDISPQGLERAGWEDTGDGPVCGDCLNNPPQPFPTADEKASAYVKTDHWQ